MHANGVLKQSANAMTIAWNTRGDIRVDKSIGVEQWGAKFKFKVNAARIVDGRLNAADKHTALVNAANGLITVHGLDPQIVDREFSKLQEYAVGGGGLSAIGAL